MDSIAPPAHADPRARVSLAACDRIRLAPARRYSRGAPPPPATQGPRSPRSVPAPVRRPRRSAPAAPKLRHRGRSRSAPVRVGTPAASPRMRASAALSPSASAGALLPAALMRMLGRGGSPRVLPASPPGILRNASHVSLGDAGDGSPRAVVKLGGLQPRISTESITDSSPASSADPADARGIPPSPPRAPRPSMNDEKKPESALLRGVSALAAALLGGRPPPGA